VGSLNHSRETLDYPSPRSIADAVPMTRLFNHLGIAVNEQTHRCPCLLHGGANPTAFSWTEDGLWHCFSCGRSGNKYDLIQSALKCDFREALKVMAVLAGVDLGAVSPSQRRRVRALQRKERRLDIAAERYAALERGWVSDYARRLRLLDRLEIFAGFCLRDSLRIGFGSMEFWCDALARIYGKRWQTLATWLLLAFGTEDTRQRFVLYESQRSALLAEVLDAGGVVDDRGHWRELML
jgi:CHC2-type zinc finger protein